MKGDFTGFSFDGIHSSELGIVRVSDGDRYEEELFPQIEDRTNEISNNDGLNYFGSDFRDKSISISIAFDSLTETQFRKIRRIFGTKKICELIFDERPYKVYSVKLADPIKLDYICFDEQKRHEGETIKNGGIRYIEKDGEMVREDITPWVYEYDTQGRPIMQRIYKGEGEIEFVTYSPFAKQLYKTLDLYSDKSKFITTYDNVDEWAESSGLLTAEQFNTNKIDKTIELTGVEGYNLEIPVYNPGDLDTGFYLYIPFNSFEEEANDSMVIPPETTDKTYYLSHMPVSGSTPIIIADPSIVYQVDEQDAHKYYITNSDTENSANISFTYNFMGTPVIKPNSGDSVKIYGDNNGLKLTTIERKGEDDGIIINTINHLIEGVQLDPITEQNNYRTKTWQITGNIYNECILKGDFPQILRSDLYLDSTQFKQAIYLNCKGEKDSIQINYDYLYF